MKKLLLSLSLIAFSTTINAQWTSQATGFDTQSRGLSQIKIIDANTVWGLAYDGGPLTPPATTNPDPQEFTLTTNGGASWTPGFIDMGNPDLDINNLAPVNATTAWVSALVPAEGHGVIFKTSDGGFGWEQQLATGFQAAASFLNGVYFFNENVGIAYGDPVAGNRFEIYRTVDGGTTWTILPNASSPVILAGEYGYNNDPIVAGGSLWFTTSKGRLYRTTDMGATFTVAQVANLADFGGVDTPGTTGSVEFSDANSGYLLKAVGTTYTYSTTSNGGTTWTSFIPFTGTRRLLTYVPGTTTIVATSADPLTQGTSVSTDNGSTWTDVESDEQRGVSAFLNATTGWCAGFSGFLMDGIFRLTSPLGTNDVTASAKFKVYPNPATSTVTISATDVDSYKLNVTDLAGKTVMTKSLSGMENNLDISALSSGAYFFEISSDNKREVVKILKN